MASVTVKHLLDLVVDVLQDEDYDEWDEPRLIDWYNIVVRKVVAAAPQANAVVDAVKLAQGVRQFIPARGIAFIRGIRNMGTDGQTPGAAVIHSSLDVIQAFDLNWSSASAAAAIETVIPDPANPAAFFVSPPADGTSYLEIEFSQMPDPITYDDNGDWESELVGVSEGFVDVVLNGVLAKAYERDSDFPGNQQRHMMYHNRGLGALGIQPEGMPSREEER